MAETPPWYKPVEAFADAVVEHFSSQNRMNFPKDKDPADYEHRLDVEQYFRIALRQLIISGVLHRPKANETILNNLCNDAVTALYNTDSAVRAFDIPVPLSDDDRNFLHPLCNTCAKALHSWSEEIDETREEWQKQAPISAQVTSIRETLEKNCEPLWEIVDKPEQEPFNAFEKSIKLELETLRENIREKKGGIWWDDGNIEMEVRRILEENVIDLLVAAGLDRSHAGTHINQCRILNPEGFLSDDEPYAEKSKKPLLEDTIETLVRQVQGRSVEEVYEDKLARGRPKWVGIVEGYAREVINDLSERRDIIFDSDALKNTAITGLMQQIIGKLLSQTQRSGRYGNICQEVTKAYTPQTGAERHTPLIDIPSSLLWRPADQCAEVLSTAQHELVASYKAHEAILNFAKKLWEEFDGDQSLRDAIRQAKKDPEATLTDLQLDTLHNGVVTACEEFQMGLLTDKQASWNADFINIALTNIVKGRVAKWLTETMEVDEFAAPDIVDTLTQFASSNMVAYSLLPEIYKVATALQDSRSYAPGSKFEYVENRETYSIQNAVNSAIYSAMESLLPPDWLAQENPESDKRVTQLEDMASALVIGIFRDPQYREDISDPQLRKIVMNTIIRQGICSEFETSIGATQPVQGFFHIVIDAAVAAHRGRVPPSKTSGHMGRRSEDWGGRH